MIAQLTGIITRKNKKYADLEKDLYYRGQVYAYEIVDLRGQKNRGEIRAPTLRAAIRNLEKKSQSIISVEKVARRVPVSRGRMNTFGLMYLFRELSVLLKSGITLQRAFEILVKQEENPDLRGILYNLLRSLEEGRSFSESLNQYPDIFTNFHRGMIRAAEEGGFLDESVNYLADVVEREVSLRKKIQTALTYPAILMVMGSLGCLLVFYFVCPYLEMIVRDMQISLPFYSVAMMKFASALRKFYFLIPFMVAMYFVVRRFHTFFRKNVYGQILWERFLFSIPGFRDLWIKATITHVLIVLSALMRSGVMLHSALVMACETCTNYHMKTALGEIAKSVTEGKSLCDSMQEHPHLFPVNLVAMIAVGEETGELPDVLLRSASLYEVELECSLESFTRLIEPLCIIVLGVLAGIVLLSFFVPIYSAINTF